jgi:hypothetical protein
MNIDLVVLNDGWLAYQNGKTADDNPYVDDADYADKWKRGWKLAKEQEEITLLNAMNTSDLGKLL